MPERIEDIAETLTCGRCGHAGDRDDDFGVRRVKERVYRQPWCRRCRGLCRDLGVKGEKLPTVDPVERFARLTSALRYSDVMAMAKEKGVKVYDGRRRVPAATVRRELAEALATA